MFENEKVKLDVLKKRAYNLRWAEVADGVIPMTAADPDYPVAKEITDAMMEYIQDGYFSYTPKMGFESFKEAISKALYERKGEDIPASQILPIDSAARAMDIIAKSFLKAGDEMIVFDPCDFLFREACLQAGGTPVFFPADLKDGLIDLSKLEEYITPKTRMIGLCNPHNPYGKSYTKEQLNFLMSLCEKYDLYIMNDEIWSDIMYPDAQFNSIYCLGNERCDRVLSVFGFSKSFGLAGLRIGCMYTTNKECFDKLDIDWLQQIISEDGSLYRLVSFDCDEECNNTLETFTSEAYDEHLEEYAQKAFDMTAETYSALRDDFQEEADQFLEAVEKILSTLEMAIRFTDKWKASKVNPQIDNT